VTQLLELTQRFIFWGITPSGLLEVNTDLGLGRTLRFSFECWFPVLAYSLFLKRVILSSLRTSVYFQLITRLYKPEDFELFTKTAVRISNAINLNNVSKAIGVKHLLES
jgi:hypothetical protein